MTRLQIETRPGNKTLNDRIFIVNGEAITTRKLLHLVKLFNENEETIIKEGKKYPDGTPYPNWFAKALKLIADNIMDFEEICEACCVPPENDDGEGVP